MSVVVQYTERCLSYLVSLHTHVHVYTYIPPPPNFCPTGISAMHYCESLWNREWRLACWVKSDIWDLLLNFNTNQTPWLQSSCLTRAALSRVKSHLVVEKRLETPVFEAGEKRGRGRSLVWFCYSKPVLVSIIVLPQLMEHLQRLRLSVSTFGFIYVQKWYKQRKERSE